MNVATAVSIGEHTIILPHVTCVKLTEEKENSFNYEGPKLHIFLAGGACLTIPFKRADANNTPEKARDVLLSAIHAYYTAQLESKHVTNNLVQGVRPHAGVEGEAG